MTADDPIRLFRAPQARNAPFSRKAGTVLLLCAGASLLLFLGIALALWMNRAPDAIPAQTQSGPPATPPSRVAPRPAAAIPSPVSRLLAFPFRAAANRKHQTFLSRPSRICDEFAEELDGDATGWGPAPVAGSGWECLIGPVTLPAGAPADPEAASIFAILRGPSPTDLTQFTVTVSLPDAKPDETALAVAEKLVAQRRFPEIALPPEALAALAAKQAFKRSYGGNGVRIMSDAGKGTRLHVIATFAAAGVATLPQCSSGTIVSLAAFQLAAPGKDCSSEKAEN